VVVVAAETDKESKMRVFPVRMPSGVQYWTVTDSDLRVVPAADAYLRHVRFGRDAADSTTKAYAGEAGQGVLVGSDVGDHGVAVQRLPGRGAGGVAKADEHLRDSLPGEHPVSHRGDKPLMSLRWSPVTVDLPAAIGAAVNVLGMQRQQKRQVRGGQWWDVLAAAGTLHDAQEHLQRLRAQRRQGVEAGVHRPAVGRRRCPRLRALDAERFGDHPARLVVIEWSGPGGGSGGDRRIQWYPAGFGDDLLMQPPQRQHRHVVARGGVLFTAAGRPAMPCRSRTGRTSSGYGPSTR